MMKAESNFVCFKAKEYSFHPFASRGGADTRKALLLALICFAGLGTGCKKAAVAPTAPRYVRIETLLPLHPNWAQVEALNRIEAGLAPPRSEMKSAASPLPAPFPFIQKTPENMANERQKRIQDDANQYLDQLTLFLLADNAQRLERETRAQQRKADAQYRKELEAKVTELAAAAAQKRAGLNAEIDRLGYKAVAYESQSRIFLGQSQLDAKASLRKVNQQIDDLTAQRDAIPTDFRPAAVALLKTRRDALNQAVNDFKGQRAAQLASDLQDQIAARSRQLDTTARTITKFGAGLPALPKPAEIALPPSPDFGAVHRAGDSAIRAALARQKAATDAQRDHLVAIIRADTEQAVQQIALRQGWKLVPAGTRSASDATADAAKALREQWQK